MARDPRGARGAREVGDDEDDGIAAQTGRGGRDRADAAGAAGSVGRVQLGTLVRRFRGRAGLTQEELAERAGMSVRGIGNIERGVPLRVRKETLRLLAEALELAPEEQATLLETARKTAWQEVPRVADESRRRDLLSEPGGFATGDRPAPTDGMVPALSSLPALSARTAVPWPVTPLVGREREVAAASAYVRGHESRLLTLCGLGGAGKTRLAAQVVIECAGEFADGAGFVPLAPISDAHLVGLTIVRHLGLRVSGGEDALSVLRGYLADKRILLLLDNFEHVLEARSVIASLLAACPGVKAVVTSRAPLRLQGEQLFPVAPLATPGAEEARRAGHADIEALARAGAIALFLQRAREMVPDFALTDDNAGSIVRICQRVDGLPLAIELAVTRLRMFSAPELAERLEHRLPVLTGGAEDLPARQQTLRNTLTWSYRLLQPEHQALFRALAVFAGGCSWEALWAVSQAVGGVAAEGAGAARETAGDNGVGESEEALVAQVGCLLDHHLLERTETKEGVSRYWMLETIREFAQEMLAHCGETACVERAHARYYVARVEAIEPLLRGNQQTVWLTWLEVEHDNVRAALGWTLRQRDGVFALRLAGALGWFWYSQGYFREGARWLEQALALPAPPGLLPGLLPGLAEPVVLSAADAAIAATADSPVIPMSALAARETDREDEVFMLSQWQALRAKALHVAGLLACYQGDYPRARMLNEEALALRRSLGDLQGVARTLNNLALVLARQGDFAGAATRYEESLALKRQIGDVEQIATTLANLGSVYVDDGDYANARRVYEGCLEQWRDQGDDSNVARTLANLGEIALREGQAARAGVLLEESLTLRRTLGDKMGLANTLHLLGTLAFEQGDSAQAFLRFRESCDLLLAVGGDRRAIVRNLEALAALYCAEGEVERAVWLSSGAAALRARLSTPARPFEQAALERTIALEHDALDDASFARAWEKGAPMRVEDVWELIRSSAIPASAHGAKSPL